MVIQNEYLAEFLQRIFFESARYLLCNRDVHPDNLKAALQCAIDGVLPGKGDEKYILRYSMDDLLRYFEQASPVMKAENDALKKSMPAPDECE